MKKCVAIFLLLVIAILPGKGWHWAKDGFQIARIRSGHALAASSVVNRALDDPRVASALNQSYRYLARGHQAYAFLSDDGQYVLKLPRRDLYVQPFWLRMCAFSFFSSYREQVFTDKEKRRRFIESSLQIAIRELKEETGLLYAHLEATSSLRKKITLRDRLGRTYVVDLDRSLFLIQEKGELLVHKFTQALREGHREEARQILDVFSAAIAFRIHKGIYNKDPMFLKNFAFNGLRGMQIDVGSFYKPKLKEIDFSTSFLQTMTPVKEWIMGLDPEMGRWFSARMEEILHESAL